jgi:hypothetical protein
LQQQQQHGIRASWTPGPPPPGTNFRRVLATSYNGGNPASTFTVAYQSDTPARVLYIASNGNDTYATGSFTNPFSSFDLAQTYLNTNAIPDNIPMIFVFAPGLQVSNIVVTRNNTFLTTYFPNAQGFEQTQPLVSQLITWSINPFTGGATRIAGGMFGINCNNLVFNVGVNLPTLFDIENCALNSASGSNVFQVNNSFNIATVINIDNTFFSSSAGTILISVPSNFSQCTLNIRNSYGTTNGASRVITTGCNTIIRDCVFTNTSASVNNQPIIQINNINASVSFNDLGITNTTLRYTSNSTDVGGNKCCIQFNNTADVNYQVLNCLLLCEGATTTNGTPGQFLCVQKTGTAGVVTFNYANARAGATAHHFPLNGATFTKTQYIAST